MKGILQRFKNKLQYEVKKVFDSQCKKDQILFAEPWNLEVNMIEMANYLATHIEKPIYFAVPKRLMNSAKKILNPQIKIINRDNWLKFHQIFYESKYVFTAHRELPSSYSKEQTIINIWHGIPYKKIGLLQGMGGGAFKPDITLATSGLTQFIFSKAFGVSEETVVIAGYPRNDTLIRSSEQKKEIKTKIKGNLSSYDKVFIWLPTFRKGIVGNHRTQGHPADNAFEVRDFEVEKFNLFLKKQNVLCLVKPHPISMQKEPSHEFSNILFINDRWLWEQGITLYDLAGCTDALISDVSSIIIDYLLIDKPIICFSADFDQYKQERGFVFDNLEDWMPTKILKTQEEFFEHLKPILETGKDDFAEKRKQLRDKFFTHQDDQSAKRLAEFLFKN